MNCKDIHLEIQISKQNKIMSGISASTVVVVVQFYLNTLVLFYATPCFHFHKKHMIYFPPLLKLTKMVCHLVCQNTSTVCLDTVVSILKLHKLYAHYICTRSDYDVNTTSTHLA